jgi:hypothetical protein
MPSGGVSNVTNQPRTSEAKNKKKKAGKTLEAPVVGASKDSSALNSPRNGTEEAPEGSGEKEHIRETLK